jgi:osmotically-inducible protein OsmY
MSERTNMTSDAKIQRDVLEELCWEPRVDATQIGVTVKDGVVALAGSVQNYADKFQAEEAAKRVLGVKAIANDIVVQLVGSRQRTDGDIALAALNALKWDAKIPEDRIHVTVRDSWIILSGAVECQFEKEAADRAVRRLIGARGVTNSILVQPGTIVDAAAESSIKKGIEAAFRRSADLDAHQIQVETSNSTVILRGEVQSWAERDDAERVAWSAPGITRVENNITITPWARD